MVCFLAPCTPPRSAGYDAGAGTNLREPFTLSLSKRCARFLQAQPERIFQVQRGRLNSMDRGIAKDLGALKIETPTNIEVPPLDHARHSRLAAVVRPRI